jgi:hypothetical protein
MESEIPAAVFAKEARRYGEAVESAPLRVEQLEEKPTRAVSAEDTAALPTSARKDVKISLDEPFGIDINDGRSITYVTPGSQQQQQQQQQGLKLATSLRTSGTRTSPARTNKTCVVESNP